MCTPFWRETNQPSQTDVPQKTTEHKRVGMALLSGMLTLLSMPLLTEAAVWYPGEFSADMTITDPRMPQNQMRGTFYIGKDRFRAEGTHQGQRRALIVHPADRKVWMLFPDDKTFYAGPGEVPIPPKPDLELLPGDKDSPCQQDKALSCTRVGNETRNGINTEKWEITYQEQPPAANAPPPSKNKLTIWVDTGRKIVIRQQPEEGPTTERTLSATENVNGRQTEKWTFTHSFQGQTRHYSQWVDAKLRIPVREDDAGKVTMELVNIQEKPQPADLFEVPKTFKEVQPPARPQATGQPDLPQAEPPSPAQPDKMQYH